MGGLDPPFSYEARVTSLFDNGQFPVNINGFSPDTPCDPDNPLLCSSEDCGLDVVCAAAPTSAPTMAPTTNVETETTTSSGVFLFDVNIVRTAMIAFGSLVPIFL
jgi:hypothetical protein